MPKPGGSRDKVFRVATEEIVVVVNDKRQFVETVAPAVARYALKHNYAQVLFKQPFTIRLSTGLDECPRPDRSVQKSQPEVVRINVSNFFNPAEQLLEVVNFFDRVDKSRGGDGIVWAKATAPRGRQVIIELKTAKGDRVKIPAIKSGDPVCLSKYATFDVLRDSSDITQCANNGLIRLMTHTEATAFFAKKAAILQTNPGELMKKSDQLARESMMNKPLAVTAVDSTQRIQDVQVSTDDVVNPRLHHLCGQVAPQLKDNDRLPVKEFMSQILDLEETMTLEDLDYLRAHGYYPTAKKWADAKWSEMAKESGLIPESDELSNS